MNRAILMICAVLAASCAESPQATDSGLKVSFRSPSEFCGGTGRSMAVDRFNLKKNGMSLDESLKLNEGVALIDAITRAVYSRDWTSESQAGAAGRSACLAYFRSYR